MKRYLLLLICLPFIILSSCSEETQIRDAVTHSETEHYGTTHLTDFFPMRINLDDSLYKNLLPAGFYSKYIPEEKSKVLCRCDILDGNATNKYFIDLYDPYFSALSQAYPFWYLDNALYSEMLDKDTEAVLKSETAFDKRGRLYEYKLNVTDSHYIKAIFSYDKDDHLIGMKIYDETGFMHSRMEAVFISGALRKYKFRNKYYSVDWYTDKDGTCHLQKRPVNFPDITFDFVLQKTPEGEAVTKYVYYSDGYYFAGCYYYDGDGNFLSGEQWSSVDNTRYEFYNEYDFGIY